MKLIFLLLSAFSLLFGAYSRDDINATVYDDQTGLTWMDDANVSSETKIWDEAIDYCENLDFAGKTDWRLPNSNELYMIADRHRYNPAIDPTFQNIYSGTYWSSTTSASVHTDAWYIHFYGGNDSQTAKNSLMHVRCVRGEQTVATSPTTMSPGIIIYLLE